MLQASTTLETFRDHPKAEKKAHFRLHCEPEALFVTLLGMLIA